MSLLQAPHTFDRPEDFAKEYILKPSMNYGLLETFFKVITDLKVKRQVIFVLPLGYVTVLDAGCDSNIDDQQLGREEKWWSPTNVEATMSQCYTDLYGSIYERELKAGNDKYDLTNTKVEGLFLELLVPAAYRDRVRMCWLSVKSIVAADLAGATAKVKYYNQIDGIWKKLTNAVTANLTPRFVIAKNAQASYAAQALATDEAQTILRGVYRNSKLILKQIDNATKVFFVTRGIYENYEDTLSNNKALESSWKTMQDGSTVLSYSGIPLVILDAVDMAIAADFDNGTKLDTPHRVVLTVKDNLQVGFDADPNQDFDTWEEKLKKRWYARMMYKLDTQIADERLVSVGY